MPNIHVFESAVLLDFSLHIKPGAPIRGTGRKNETKLWGTNVSALYVWTKNGEDQAETIEVKLHERRGIFTATFVNNRLVELDLNGRKIRRNLLKYKKPTYRILSRIRKISTQK